MNKPLKPIKAFKHKEAKRAHIPSAEEAGYEEGSPKVKQADQLALPLNPIITRGQDPELFWLNKYQSDERVAAQLATLQEKLKSGDTAGAKTVLQNLRDTLMRRNDLPGDDTLSVDIRSLYRHEHIAPETLIKSLYRIVAEKSANQDELFAVNELFGNAIGHEELDKVSDYYTHSDGWSNRLIQGDSLLVMTSLLEREGMAGQVQCIYMDPPYGIKYGSNWQIRLNSRNIKDGDDDSLSGEPEQVKAFRDTWELGIHSYLKYLRERLLIARELLHESGSCFIQISDENMHLVRLLMDEVFGSGNFCSQINFRTAMTKPTRGLNNVFDYLIWYTKNKESHKFRELFAPKESTEGLSHHQLQASAKQDVYSFSFNGTEYNPPNGWRVPIEGMRRLSEAGRLYQAGKTSKKTGTLKFARFESDFAYRQLDNTWDQQSSEQNKDYVVQTAVKIIQRCILMTTDPGDLILDPTCGSGTTAYVAEQWGRRWITCDTSRIALNIAKARLMTATLPYFQLYDRENCDVRLGFVYERSPHITMGTIANGEPPIEETLYDHPLEDKKRLRVAGPFTVETLQSYEPISAAELARQRAEDKDLGNFEELVFAHLKSAGIKTGDKRENAVFVRIDRLAHSSLHAEGFYTTAAGEKKAYLHIGPKFGTVSKQAVTEAIKACRDKRDGDWLLIMGFAFESGITELSRNFGNFQVSIVRMHDDLLQQGLLKKDKKAASFVTIGEPDIRLHRSGDTATVEIAGLDIYDPIKDEVKSRDVHDIAYWMLDDNYDGSNFITRQVFFCGGDKDEFADWKKGLSNLAAAAAKKKAEQTLKIQIDEEAFARLYGHQSHPFPIKKGQKIAIRVISQFGEETTKVIEWLEPA